MSLCLKAGELSQLLTEGSAKESKENSATITMIFIPSGTFAMGSPETEKARSEDEKQADTTITQPFLMSQTEITQQQWLAVTGKNLQQQIDTQTGPIGRGAKLVDNPPAIGDEQPMCFVNHADALAFCEQLTKKDQEAGLIDASSYYTLPTEAQWEYACRAGSTTVFAYGDSLTSKQANFYGKSSYGTKEDGPYLEKTSTVKSYKPNKWDLYDMHGNLYEWCLDWYTEALQGGNDPQGADKGDSRVIRGGAWNRRGSSCRSAYRYSYDPTRRTYNIGFRIVLTKK